MAEKENIDINDSDAIEFSALEELDLTDQIEIIPDEKESVEALEVFQGEIVPEEIEEYSSISDGGTVNKVEPLSILEENELELPLKETEAENPSELVGEDQIEEGGTGDFDDDEFLGLDDEEFSDSPSEKQVTSPTAAAEESSEKDKSEKISEKNSESAEDQENDIDNDKNSVKFAKRSEVKTNIRKPSPIQFIIGFTLLLIIIAGGAFYMRPSLFGFEKEAAPVPIETTAPGKTTGSAQSVQTVPGQIAPARSPNKNEIYMARIKDAGDLRDRLLSKKEEIFQLKLRYQNSIADLGEQIHQAMQTEGITSFTGALQNQAIELNLRTIQRRRSYIRGLEKPTQWIIQGSEELLYLKRKAEFDLELIEIAGGIDMDKHMRHISAAIQKFQPSAEKLAVNRENMDLSPLETIWGQIQNQTNDTEELVPNVTDKIIMKEICSGNYERVTELTSLTAETAQCLSKMTGVDLFLNRLTTLSPAAAQSLYRWRGRWICMNGVKNLSPTAAKYLFRWDGNWISLNGLTEFPPELATYLMEWDGRQLELMGLEYNRKNTDQKALKYLALWETMGGKLYISDDVRRELARVLM
jgi:hypothetical protein